MDRLDYASEPRHYIKLIVTVAIMLVGVYLRFAEFRYASLLSTVIFLIGAIWMFRIVFRIMEEPAKRA
jgi:hypothetical protein